MVGKRHFALLCAIVGYFLTWTPQVFAALNINVDAVQRSVIFLYPADQTGNVDAQRPLGTAFLLRAPSVSGDRFFVLVATARHILDPEWAKCGTPNPPIVYARFNREGKAAGVGGDGTIFVRLSLVQDGKPLWTHPSDNEADAAVLVVPTPDTLLKGVGATILPVSDLPTDQEANSLGIGDQIVSAGLVPGLQGARRNQPFFKFGYISTKSDETVEVSCAANHPPNSIKGWFVAANLVNGNSGSPVWYVPPGASGVRFVSAVNRPVLIGIQSSSIIPADLAVVTPSSHLFEAIQLLHLPEADLYRGPERPKPAKK